MPIEADPRARQMCSDAKFFSDYSRYDESLGRYENWDEAVTRVMNMHREKYDGVMTNKLAGLIGYAEEAYKDKLILGSQRALQFGGPQIFKHNARLYNCAFSYADRPKFFQQAMYLLLAGCGVGFSVQFHHVAKMPAIREPNNQQCKVFTVPDSIEGWADAFGVLFSTYLTADAPFPEYQGQCVHFDVSKIRPEGAYISGGFKAPGPAGLVRSLEECRKLLDSAVAGSNGRQIKLKPIQIYDYVMHMADAVLSGGIRRAATICIFSKEDMEMMTAKTGNWRHTNPQRGRSNNSVLLLRNEVLREEWKEIFNAVRQFGEPGFIFADDLEAGFNPCVEIGLRGYTADGRSGFQMCNLTEGNGGLLKSREVLMRYARASSIMGTLQAGYTDFGYLGKESEEITAREALLGCSITGWMNNPQVLFDEDNMRDAARLIKSTNREVAEMIGINPAARTTTSKPAGNSSVILSSAAAMGPEHAPKYIRNVQYNKQLDVAKLIAEHNPQMVEESLWSPNKTDYVVSFPVVIDNPDAIFRNDVFGVQQLEYVKKAQQIWIEEGTDLELCVDKRLRHNISNTITVKDWDEVEQYIYDNRDHFAGISLLGAYGDRDYVQSPMTEVFSPEELVEMYGQAAIFASGLVVDGCHAFNNNLWLACDTALGRGEDLTEDSKDLQARDWVRRLKKFANNFFEGDVQKATYCLKDVSNLHRWEKIVRNFKFIDFASELKQAQYVDANTMGAAGCAGGACEWSPLQEVKQTT